ncbi:MAG: hypothetical protein HYX60_04470 [Legionella longbeachae]|nr:hypothetical protein [Legionella longbeachae]
MLRIIILLLFYSISYAKCIIYYNENPLTKKKQDAVSTLLDKEITCPQSIQGFKRLIQSNYLQVKTSMVANRGKNNPHLGSFSFFESITGVLPDGFQINPGEFYLGYFTKIEQDEIQLDKLPDKNKLLIELIAWDNKRQIFNFYELRGLDATKTRWYYRGNSQDALLDNQYLYRNNPPKSAKFGSRMRCSACHNSGGPIMKEFKTSHNDWWTNANQLIFLPNHPDDEINILVNTLVDAKKFSREVRAGIKKLNLSAHYKKFKRSLTLQEQLRPLFCTTEINIESNKIAGINAPITIPSGFWLNPLLGQIKIMISGHVYQRLLIKNNMQFPETDLNDADHAWLTPVKGINDINTIEHLIKNKIITRHFAQSVLMIDYAHPVFSKHRCELLKFIPLKFNYDWMSLFIKNLYQIQTKQPEALLLVSYLTNSQKYNEIYFQKILSQYKNNIWVKTKSDTGLQEIFIQLLKTRQDVIENELSQNPLGQILEPGFRVIFPISTFWDI